MSRPLVLLDCDGVLADFVGAYLRAAAEVTGRHYSREQVTEWDIDACIGLSSPTRRAVAERIMEPGFCLALEVFPGAKEGVAALRKVADVVCATSPWSGLYWTGERTEWLWHHFRIQQRDVIHASRKDLVAGDFLVDDRVTNCIAWERRWAPGRAVIWDTPHNRMDDAPGMARASSWESLVSLVTERR